MLETAENGTGLKGRARLIGAALSCMAEVGLKGATVRKIADRANVTPGLVKHHFGDKEGLLVEAYRSLNEKAVARIAGAVTTHSDDLETALSDAIAALFPNDLSDVQHMRVLVAFWGLVLTNPKFANVQSETHAATRKLFFDLCKLHLESADKARDFADGIIALTDGLWLECCMNPYQMAPPKAIAIALGFCRMSLQLHPAD